MTNKYDPQEHIYMILMSGDEGLQVITARMVDNYAWKNILPIRFNDKKEAIELVNNITDCVMREDREVR